jgi:hypothetical protein
VVADPSRKGSGRRARARRARQGDSAQLDVDPASLPPEERRGSGPGCRRRLSGRVLRPLSFLPGEQFVDRGAQVGQPVLQLLKLVGHRPVVVVGMGVAARTGRLGLLSAAWFAGMAAAVGERHDLLGVVAQGFGDLAVQRRVVVVEVPEEGLQTRSGHARTLAGPSGAAPVASREMATSGDTERAGPVWGEPDKCLNSGGNGRSPPPVTEKQPPSRPACGGATDCPLS